MANAAVTPITFRSGSVIADIEAADAAAVAAIQGLSIQDIMLVLSAADATTPKCAACAAEFSSKGGCNFYDVKQGEFTGNSDSLIPAGCMPCVAVAKALCSAGPTPPSGEQAAAIDRMAAQLETVVQEIADMKADVKDIKTGMENFDAKWDTFLNAAGCPRTKTRFRFRRAGLGP